MSLTLKQIREVLKSCADDDDYIFVKVEDLMEELEKAEQYP